MLDPNYTMIRDAEGHRYYEYKGDPGHFLLGELFPSDEHARCVSITAVGKDPLVERREHFPIIYLFSTKPDTDYTKEMKHRA